MTEVKEKTIINCAYELLRSRDWKCKDKQVDDEQWNKEMVTKCFDLSKEFTKQIEEFLNPDEKKENK